MTGAWANIAAYAIAGIIAFSIFGICIKILQSVLALSSERIADLIEDMQEETPDMMTIIGIIAVLLIVGAMLVLLFYSFPTLLKFSYLIVAKLAELFEAVAGFIPRK